MPKKLLLSTVLVFVASCAIAQDDNMVRATRIAQALGLEQLLRETQLQNVAATRQSMLDLLEELKKNGYPAKIIADVRVDALEFADDAVRSWDPKEAARIYANGLVQSLSEDELVATERHYQTETGKKSYEALSNSQARMIDYINAKQNEAMKAKMSALISKVRDAAIRSQNSATK